MDFDDATIAPPDSFCVPASHDDDGWLESLVSDFGAVLTGLVDEIAALVDSAIKKGRARRYSAGPVVCCQKWTPTPPFTGGGRLRV
jgi:hypothetical protein